VVLSCSNSVSNVGALDKSARITSVLTKKPIRSSNSARVRLAMGRPSSRSSDATDAAAYRERAADNGAVGRQMVSWRQALEQKWSTLRFGDVRVETRDEQQLFNVQVFLNDLDPKAVRIELYADGVPGSPPVRQEMKRVRQMAGESGGSVYSTAVSAARPPADYTARVIPHHDGVAIPLEDARILWQR